MLPAYTGGSAPIESSRLPISELMKPSTEPSANCARHAQGGYRIGGEQLTDFGLVCGPHVLRGRTGNARIEYRPIEPLAAKRLDNHAAGGRTVAIAGRDLQPLAMRRRQLFSVRAGNACHEPEPEVRPLALEGAVVVEVIVSLRRVGDRRI